jgi:hypothetical protein
MIREGLARLLEKIPGFEIGSRLWLRSIVKSVTPRSASVITWMLAVSEVIPA